MFNVDYIINAFLLAAAAAVVVAMRRTLLMLSLLLKKVKTTHTTHDQPKGKQLYHIIVRKKLTRFI